MLGAAVMLTLTCPAEGPLALDSLPEGVTAHTVEGVPLFLVRQGRDVKGFSTTPSTSRMNSFGGARLRRCSSRRSTASSSTRRVVFSRGQVSGTSTASL